MKEKTLWIVRTAMLLALCVVFQSLRLWIGDTIVSVIIIGSLVNLVLYLSVKIGGIYSGLAVSILSPIIALFQGHIKFPQMVLVVLLGNAVLVLIFWLFSKKDNQLLQIGGIAAASVAKFIVLWIAVSKFIIPSLTQINEVIGIATAKGKPVAAIAKGLATTLNLNFSWPQLVTALVGGVLLLAIVPALKMAKVIKN